MRLTNEQIRSFKTRGYLAVPHFFNVQETEALQAETERLKQFGLLVNVVTEGQAQNLSIDPLDGRSTLIRALPFEPKVAEAVGQLIGEPFILHRDQIFLKPARHGMGTAWHQDNYYFKINEVTRGTAMWVAVHEATVENGTMFVVPDLFKEPLEHLPDTKTSHLYRCFPPEDRALPIELPAGGAVFFNYGVPHCTKQNNTDKERAGLAFHFIHLDCKREAALIGAETRHPIIRGPGASGGEIEFGKRVAGTFAQEVEKLQITVGNL